MRCSTCAMCTRRTWLWESTPRCGPRSETWRPTPSRTSTRTGRRPDRLLLNAAGVGSNAYGSTSISSHDVATTTRPGTGTPRTGGTAPRDVPELHPLSDLHDAPERRHRSPLIVWQVAGSATSFFLTMNNTTATTRTTAPSTSSATPRTWPLPASRRCCSGRRTAARPTTR